MVPEIMESEFKEKVLDVPYPVLVDFFATWCGPCKMMAPVLDQVAVSKQGKAAVYKIDVDQNQSLAASFDVMSVPTLLVFKEGQLVQRFVGMQSASLLEASLS